MIFSSTLYATCPTARARARRERDRTQAVTRKGNSRPLGFVCGYARKLARRCAHAQKRARGAKVRGSAAECAERARINAADASLVCLQAHTSDGCEEAAGR
eukprot:2818520-Pleurochrysis_carterae.AAC.1